MVKCNTKKYRVAAVAVTVSILLMIMLSFGFIALHTNHNCAGDDCGICLVLHNANGFIKQLLQTSVISQNFIALCLFALFIFQKYSQTFGKTLISLKVRIND